MNCFVSSAERIVTYKGMNITYHLLYMFRILLSFKVEKLFIFNIILNYRFFLFLKNNKASKKTLILIFLFSKKIKQL